MSYEFMRFDYLRPLSLPLAKTEILWSYFQFDTGRYLCSRIKILSSRNETVNRLQEIEFTKIYI